MPRSFGFVGRHPVLPAYLIATLSLSGCSIDGSFFSAAGPVAEAQRAHFLSVLGWMAIVVLPIAIGLPYVLWRYRAGRDSGDYAPDWEFNWKLEVLIWVVPAVVVVALAVNLWRETIALDPYKAISTAGQEEPLTINVIAMDWKFLFLYPDGGVATVNEIVVPAGRPLRFRLTSQTVMQSFIVPRLGGQIYAMAGMTTELNLLASKPGDYTGQNAQYNGKGFAKQKFTLRAVSPEEYETWLGSVKSDGKTLDMAGYEELTKPSVPESPSVYASYPADLFKTVLGQFHGHRPADTPSQHSEDRIEAGSPS